MKLKGLDKILLFAARAKAAANAADIAVIETNVGDLTDLDTTDKSNLVDALNETYAKAGSNAAAIGTLTDLDTTDKSNLVDALNETYNIAVGYSSDGLKEDVSILQDEVEIIESAIRQINPTGAATATVTSFDTVNSLPVNAAQAGLGVVQEGMTATNLTDGDFSATADWTSTFGTFTVSNGVASFLANAQNQNAQQALTAIATHKYYVRAYVKTTTGTTDIAIRFNDGTNTTDTAIASSTAWQKVSAIITAGASGAGFVGLVDKRASAWDTIQIKEFRTVNLTAIAKEAATLSQADAMLLDYFSGTQSAVTGRIRSVGKNLFDGASSNTAYSYRASRVWDNGTLTVRNTYGTSVAAYSTYTVRLQPNQVYRIKASSERLVGAADGGGIIVYKSDSSSPLGGNGGTALNPDFQFTAPSNGLVIILFYVNGTLNDVVRFTNIQLELGTVATPYEPYRKTESYTKPMPLRRLPNTTLDDVTNGKHTKRVSEWANVTGASFASIDNATYTNVSVVKTTAFSLATAGTTAIDNSIIYHDKNGVALAEVAQADIDNLASIDKFYYHTDKTVWRILAKGSLDIATARTNLGTETILYQLLTPVITENVSSGTLLAYPSGTVYWEPVIADVAIYATGATILNTGYPISSLESIYKIDLVTGEQTPLAVSSATVASGGLSFTHTGLVDGDMVGFTYYFSHPYPYGENDYTYYNAVSNATYTKGVKTDLVEPNDFTVTTGAEKTLVLATSVYNDITIQAANLRVGITPPTLAAFQDSIYAMKFIDGQTDIVYGSFELPHGYKEGTDLELHLHWSPSTTDTGDCVFNFAYSIAGVDGTFGAEATKTFTQAGSGTVNKHQYVSGNTVISGTGLTIGTTIVFALSRPTGDSFTGDAFLHSVGVHYAIDTMGSRTAAAK